MQKWEETRLRNLLSKERVEKLNDLEKTHLRRLARKKKQEGSPQHLGAQIIE
jgi:hypothetical protein